MEDESISSESENEEDKSMSLSENEFDNVDEMISISEMNKSNKLSKNPIKLSLEDKVCNLLMNKFPDQEGLIVSEVLPQIM